MWAAKSLGWVLLGLVRLLTVAQARWYGCPPKAEQRIYFANHQSHIDLVMIWAALPLELRQAVLAAYNAARAAHCRAPRDDQEQLNRAYGVAFRECQDHLRRAPRTPAQSMSTVAFAADGARVTYAHGRRL